MSPSAAKKLCGSTEEDISSFDSLAGLMAVNCLQSAQYLSLVDNHLSGLRTGMCLPSATSNLR